MTRTYLQRVLRNFADSLVRIVSVYVWEVQVSPKDKGNGFQDFPYLSTEQLIRATILGACTVVDIHSDSGFAIHPLHPHPEILYHVTRKAWAVCLTSPLHTEQHLRLACPAYPAEEPVALLPSTQDVGLSPSSLIYTNHIIALRKD